MSSQILPSYFLLSGLFSITLVLFADDLKAQKLTNNITLTTQLSFHVFSDRVNKISGYATGKSLTYNLRVLNSLNFKSIGIVFNNKDLSKIWGGEKLRSRKFGNTFSLIGLLNFSILDNQKVKLILSPGMGLSYLDKTWYTNNNPIISSHLNFSPTANLKLSIGLGTHTELLAGMGIIHYSNAAVRIPNNGLNIVDLNVGFTKLLIAHKPLKFAKYKNPDLKRHIIELGISIGSRGVFYQKRSLYKTATFLGYRYNFNPRFGINTGIDAIYYHSIFDNKRYAETYQSKATSLARWRVGVGVGPAVTSGRLSITTIYGYYLYFDSYQEVNSYWNGSVKYKINNWVAFQAKLFGHREEVDFLGIGMVLSWIL